MCFHGFYWKTKNSSSGFSRNTVTHTSENFAVFVFASLLWPKKIAYLMNALAFHCWLCTVALDLRGLEARPSKASHTE